MIKGVYKIVCNYNDRVYISASTDVEESVKRDIKDLEMRRHTVRALQRDWNRHGRKRFNGYIVGKVADNHSITKAKQQAIRRYLKKGVHLYNDIEGYDDVIIVYRTDNPEQIADEFLTTRKCAKFLGVSHTRVARALKQNRIKPCSFIKKKYVVCHKAVYEWHLEYIKKLMKLEPNAIELKNFKKTGFKILK